jgi:hypothetical protein
VTEFIGRHAAEWFANTAVRLFQALGHAMPEVATVAVVFCAALLMVTGNANRWLGRAAVAVFVGVVWRMLLI